MAQSDGEDDGDPPPPDEGTTESTEPDGESGGSSGGSSSTGDPPDPSTTGAPAETVNAGPAVLDCDLRAGYDVSSWRADDPSAPQLWVGGVYETTSGKGTVEWSLPGEHVLVVSAYEATDWTITLSGDGQLARVIAVGYEVQTIVAPGVPVVEAYSLVGGDAYWACGYSLPGEGGGCEGEDLVALAEELTGLSAGAFDGCYRASAFAYVAIE